MLNLVTGDGREVGARLASHPDVDKIAFTGSTAVGREIMKLASGTVKKISLELGGKGRSSSCGRRPRHRGRRRPVRLHALLGPDLRVRHAPLVHEGIHDAFVERLVERASTIKLGDPTDFDTDMGPVISARQRDRILDYLERAKAEGATVALGGGTPEARSSRRASGSSRPSSPTSPTT